MVQQKSKSGKCDNKLVSLKQTPDPEQQTRKRNFKLQQNENHWRLLQQK